MQHGQDHTGWMQAGIMPTACVYVFLRVIIRKQSQQKTVKLIHKGQRGMQATVGRLQHVLDVLVVWDFNLEHDVHGPRCCVGAGPGCMPEA
jgi:hypothetical protein